MDALCGDRENFDLKKKFFLVYKTETQESEGSKENIIRVRRSEIE